MLARSKSNIILIITNIPTPYRIPLFNELSRQVKSEGLKLNVLFGALGYPRRRWKIDMSECKFDYVLLSGKKISYSDPEKNSCTYSGLYRIISEYRPSVIITNGFSIATIKLWWRSLFVKTNYIIWSGAISRRNGSDSFLRRLQRKMLIKRAIGFIAYGTKAKEYLAHLGALPDKVEIGINTVDTRFYAEQKEKLRKNMTYRNSKKHLLYIGYLSQRKNVLKVLEVVNDLAKERSDFFLDIVGDGEDRIRLEKYVNENELKGFIKFHGFKQKSEIPLFLAQSDCFLFQTDFDIWGLALVEGMAAGLPCIASIHAGATHDLIKDGVTGFVADFSETENVAERINWILDNPAIAEEIGQNASRFIEENVTIQHSAAGFVRAVTTLIL